MAELTNLTNRESAKQDRTGARTAEDVMRRLAENVKVTSDEVNGLTIEVSGKVGNNEVISKINQSPEQVTIQANKIKLEGYTTINNGFSVDTNGNMTCNNATMNNASVVGGGINLTTVDTTANFEIKDSQTAGNKWSQSARKIVWNGVGSGYMEFGNYHTASCYIALNDNNGSGGNTTSITPLGITTPAVSQTSLATRKKNFEKVDEKAIDIIKDIDIYKYNLKDENDGTKKHYGFVIGDDYKYRKELTNIDNNGVDLYSFISVCCKAIQEQQEEIEELRKLVNKNDKN